jgi:mannose-6-phosphate isomerase-like protein (cupin superfamily)
LTIPACVETFKSTPSEQEHCLMTVVSPDRTSTFNIPGVTFTGLAAPSRGARESAVWRVRMLPGTPPNPHRLTREEVIVAVSGSARVSIAGVESDLPEGCAVIVPPDTEFALFNPGDAPFEAIAVLPVGGKAVLADAVPFTPPWAE